MKAAVMRDISVLNVEEVPEPQPGPDQIKVKIAYCGICGTDMEILEGRFGLAKLAGKSPKDPSINGHEASGTIVALGSQVQQGYKIGQRVAMNFRATCGACYYCRNKMEQFCQKAFHATGSFAEYAIYKEGSIYLLPENISMEQGALLEPVSVALHGVDRADIHPGSFVAISGAGPIGLLMLQLARMSGAARVMVSDPVIVKRNIAQDLGADVTVDPIKEDLTALGNKLTDGRGFDTVIEASGNLGAARQTFSLAGPGATIVWAAVYPLESEIPVNPFMMFAKELNIRSVFVSPYSFPRALNLLPKLNLKPIISDIVPLQDIAQAFEMHKKGNSVKILIKM